MKETGYIYISLADGTYTVDQKYRIKIGKTKHTVAARNHQIEKKDRYCGGTFGPCQIVPLHWFLAENYHRVEKILHTLYRPFKVRLYEEDEWFELNLQQIALLCRLQSKHLNQLIETNIFSLDALARLVNEEVAAATLVVSETESSSQEVSERSVAVLTKDGIEYVSAFDFN